MLYSVYRPFCRSSPGAKLNSREKDNSAPTWGWRTISLAATGLHFAAIWCLGLLPHHTEYKWDKWLTQNLRPWSWLLEWRTSAIPVRKNWGTRDGWLQRRAFYGKAACGTDWWIHVSRESLNFTAAKHLGSHDCYFPAVLLSPRYISIP